MSDVLDRKAGQNSVSDDRIMKYAQEHKLILITKDKNLKARCRKQSIPFIDLISAKAEALLVDQQLKELQAWKEYL